MNGTEPYAVSRSEREAECLGGGYAYVGHGEDVILLAFTQDVGWWRNSVGLLPDDARRLAAALIQQADAVSSDRPDGAV